MSTSPQPDRAARVALSLVVPLYDVERYLPDLLDSIAAQEPGPYDLQCVFVDDGSPDGSAALVERWVAEAKPASVDALLIRQANAGVSAARNRGLAAATGEWVGFPDSDDALGERWCAEVAAFVLARGEATTAVATNLVKHIEAEGRLLDNHSLRFKFQQGARVVRLADEPHFLQMHAASTVFRRADLEHSGIRFLPGLHASEDALFVADVLAAAPDPALGVVPGAVYRYRKRASADSAVDRYRTRAETWFERFDLGYLPALARLAAERGNVPAWFQNQVLYELKWLLVAEEKEATKAHVLTAEQRVAFLGRVSAVLAHVDDALILDYRVTPLNRETRALLLALKGSPVPPLPLLARGAPGTVEVRSLFVGRAPEEEVLVRGKTVAPLGATSVPLGHFDQTLVQERRTVVPAARRAEVRLDGERFDLALPRLRDPLPVRGLRLLRRTAGRALRGVAPAGRRHGGRDTPLRMPAARDIVS
jgi:glycosyltransferase involved in cell wall biosynthesis